MTEMKKHMKDDHDEDGKEVSREICPHYRRGNCFKGDRCNRSHAGYQQENISQSTSKKSPTRTTTSDWTPACKHGDDCSWMAKGRCMFFHRNVGVQKPAKQPQQERPIKQARGPCKFGARCDRIETCSWSHSEINKSAADVRHRTRGN